MRLGERHAGCWVPGEGWVCSVSPASVWATEES